MNSTERQLVALQYVAEKAGVPLSLRISHRGGDGLRYMVDRLICTKAGVVSQLLYMSERIDVAVSGAAWSYGLYESLAEFLEQLE